MSEEQTSAACRLSRPSHLMRHHHHHHCHCFHVVVFVVVLDDVVYV